MNKIKMTVAGLALSAILAIPGAALADDCANFSRPAPADPTSCVVQGNWVYLGCTGFQHWGFITPGTDLSSMGISQPDANGNYTNGKVNDLLGVSAICDPSKGVVLKRQNGAILTGEQLQGIWSGCGS
jgi:hypothetical protein